MPAQSGGTTAGYPWLRSQFYLLRSLTLQQQHRHRQKPLTNVNAANNDTRDCINGTAITARAVGGIIHGGRAPFGYMEEIFVPLPSLSDALRPLMESGSVHGAIYVGNWSRCEGECDELRREGLGRKLRRTETELWVVTDMVYAGYETVLCVMPARKTYYQRWKSIPFGRKRKHLAIHPPLIAVHLLRVPIVPRTVIFLRIKWRYWATLSSCLRSSQASFKPSAFASARIRILPRTTVAWLTCA